MDRSSHIKTYVLHCQDDITNSSTATTPQHKRFGYELLESKNSSCSSCSMYIKNKALQGPDSDFQNWGSILTMVVRCTGKAFHLLK